MSASRAMAIAGLLAAGCDDNFHDDYNLVEGLRLLGVVADPPEAGAGDTVRLRAFAVHRAAGPITMRWAICTLPPIPGTGTVNPACLDPAPDWLAWTDFHDDTADIGVPGIASESLGPADGTGGRYLPVRIGLDDGAERLDALYRLRFHERGDLNRNPAIERVEVSSRGGLPLDESAPLEVAAGETMTLRALMKGDSAEEYTAREGATAGRELISITWFSTAGRFDGGSTGDGVDIQLDLGRNSPAAGSAIDLWVVARDGRGGSAVAHRVLQVK